MEGENVKKVFKLTDAFYSLLLLVIPFFFELWMLGIFKQPFSVYWALGISVIYLVALSSKYRKIRNLENCFHSLGDKAEKADKENTEIKNKYENLKNEHENLKSEHENLKYENTQLKENEKEKNDELQNVLNLIKQSLELIVKQQSQILEDRELSREHLVKEEQGNEEQKTTTDEAIEEENIAEISDSDEMQSPAKTKPDNEEGNDSGIQTEAETAKEEEVPVIYPEEGSGKAIYILLRDLENDELLWEQGIFYKISGKGSFEIIESLEKIYIYPRKVKTNGKLSLEQCDNYGYKRVFEIEPVTENQIKITKIIPAEVKIVGQDKIILLHKGKIITSENG